MERKLTVKHDDSKCLSGTKDGLNGLEKGTKQLRNLLTVLAKLGTRAKNFTHSMPCIIAPGLKVVIRLITILESWQKFFQIIKCYLDMSKSIFDYSKINFVFLP